MAPALPANVTIGLLFGASAVQAGIAPASATAFSLFAVAARAQLAAVELLQDGATLPVVLATILLINLRYVTFSAAIAPKIDHLPRFWKAIVAYPLIDITYTVAEARFSRAESGEFHRGWYFLGIGGPWVVVYTGSTLVGTLFGRVLGAGLQLDFMIPLLFIALLVSQVDTRPELLSAIGAGAIAAIAIGLPYNLGLLVAALLGAAVGGLVDVRGETDD